MASAKRQRSGIAAATRRVSHALHRGLPEHLAREQAAAAT
jgi:hypothetical protein